jgi:hypothetical protein
MIASRVHHVLAVYIMYIHAHMLLRQLAWCIASPKLLLFAAITRQQRLTLNKLKWETQ